MRISAERIDGPRVVHVEVSEDHLQVELRDGRTVSVPLSWYPRLEHATNDELSSWKLIGGGTGIHWAGIDEDISIEALLAGKASSESQVSLRRWLDRTGS